MKLALLLLVWIVVQQLLLVFLQHPQSPPVVHQMQGLLFRSLPSRTLLYMFLLTTTTFIGEFKRSFQQPLLVITSIILTRGAPSILKG